MLIKSGTTSDFYPYICHPGVGWVQVGEGGCWHQELDTQSKDCLTGSTQVSKTISSVQIRSSLTYVIEMLRENCISQSRGLLPRFRLSDSGKMKFTAMNLEESARISFKL